MASTYRDLYCSDVIETGDRLHRHFFNIFSVIFENRLTDTGMFKHPYVPDFFCDVGQKVFFYIRFNTANLQKEIDSLSKYHISYPHRIIIILLEGAENIIRKDFFAAKNILVVSGEAIDCFLNQLMSNRKISSFSWWYLKYLREIFYEERKLLKKDEMKKRITQYAEYEKCA